VKAHGSLAEAIVLLDLGAEFVRTPDAVVQELVESLIEDLIDRAIGDGLQKFV
jgi:hypothetical protein